MLGLGVQLSQRVRVSGVAGLGSFGLGHVEFVEQHVERPEIQGNMVRREQEHVSRFVTLEKLHELFPFGNTIVITELTGEQVKAMLDAPFCPATIGRRCCRKACEIM